jgi:broad specificity phosphatase PhoE
LRTIIHLVRHGEVHNPRKVRYGRLPGFVLSTNGKEQAARAAAHLASLSPRPSFVMSSPLERAMQTAGILRDHLLPGSELRVDERLLEATSIFDGLPRKAPLPDIWRVWRDPAREARNEPPGEVARRMRAVVLDAARELRRAARARAGGEPGEGAAAALVTHQSPVGCCRAAMVHGLGSEGEPLAVRLAPWAFQGVPCSYASITSFAVEADGRAELLGYWAP